jgi:hypothetical protein
MNFMERLLKNIPSFLVATALFLQGCGSGGGVGNDLVRSLNVVTSPSGNDILVSVSTELNAGNLVFPAITLPIVDPKNPARPYGTLTMQRTLDGKNMLTVQVNVTRIAGDRNLVAPPLLPNGTNIPVAGVKDVVALQAGSSSRVYVSLNDTTKMLGVAVAIKEFDSIAKYVPGANLFFDIPQTNGIRGLAGIFTGTTSGTSGFGIFLDATDALKKLQMAPVANKVIGLSQDRNVAARSLKTSVASEIRFIAGSNQDSRTTQRLQMRAYTLSQERKRISIVTP